MHWVMAAFAHVPDFSNCYSHDDLPHADTTHGLCAGLSPPFSSGLRQYNSAAMRRPLPPVSKLRCTTVRSAQFLPRSMTIPGRHPCSPNGAQTVEPIVSIRHGAGCACCVDSMTHVFMPPPPPVSPRLRRFELRAFRRTDET